MLQKEGQKTKWVVDLVMKIDEEYKQELVSRRQTIVGRSFLTSALRNDRNISNDQAHSMQ